MVQNNEHASLEPWSQRELQTSLQGISRAITQVYGQTASYVDPRFCLFIDGLDEYAGNHGELVQTLRDFVSGDDTKLCVSSRPWNIFSRAFGNSKPHLLLQDLTHNDIKLYVNSSIENALARSLIFYPADISKSDIKSLTSEIVGRAEGVFLWVYLAVQSVLRGLDEGDHITMLRQRVLEFPQDLGHFFESILERVESVYHNQTAQALCLAYLYVSDPDAAEHSSYLDYELLGRSPTGLWDCAYLWDLEPRIFSPAETIALAQKTQSFLGACCKDLLILPLARAKNFATEPANLKVQFLHRTVYDYMQTTGRFKSFMQKVPPSFKDGSAFHLLNMAKLKITSNPYSAMKSAYFIKQTEYSLGRYWPGLTIEFVEQLRHSQSIHQRNACSSIAAAYIAFGQHTTFRDIYPVRRRRFFCSFEYMCETKSGKSPQCVLLSAALGLAKCNRFAYSSVDTTFLSSLLDAFTLAPKTGDETQGEGNIAMAFFAMTIDALVPAGVEAAMSPTSWNNFYVDPSLQHLRCISQILLKLRAGLETYMLAKEAECYGRSRSGLWSFLRNGHIPEMPSHEPVGIERSRRDMDSASPAAVHD